MRTIPMLILSTLLLCAALPVLAETYRYTDDRGTINFVDDLNQIPKKYRKNARTADNQAAVNIVTAAKPTKQTKAEPAPAERPAASVDVFVTSWCGYCKKTLNYLNEKGIPYTAYDIEKDEAANQRYQELGGRGVPVIVINGKVIRGFNPEAIDSYTGR